MKKYRCTNFVEISTNSNWVIFTGVDDLGKTIGNTRFDKLINFICDKESGKIITIDYYFPYTDGDNFKPINNETTIVQKNDNSGKQYSITQKGSVNAFGVAIARGLQGRSILSLPCFTDEFKNNAKVAVDIHVDADGNVVGADYQPRGSTTADASMESIGLRMAYQIRFNRGSDESVGTIIFNFKMGK